MTSNNMGQTQFQTINRAANQTSNASLLSMGLSCTRNLGNLGVKDELKFGGDENKLLTQHSPENKKHIKK